MKNIKIKQTNQKTKTKTGWFREEAIFCDETGIGYVRFEQNEDDYVVTTHHNNSKQSVDGVNLGWLVGIAEECGDV